MTLIGFLVLLVIAGVCGSLGAGLAGYSHFGCLSSIVLGFVGAWVGAWVARQLHLPTLWVVHVQRESFPVVWSILGAGICAGVASILTARNTRGF
jgi:uncharacterized membrane protein YeaQ/YmgE (transglycosylase-associated protein family)